MHKLAAVAWHAIVAIEAGAGEGVSVRCLLHYSLIPLASPSSLLALTIPRPLELRNGNRLPLVWLPIYNSHYPPLSHSTPLLHLFLLLHHAAHASHMLHTSRNDIFYFYLFCSFSLFCCSLPPQLQQEQVQQLTYV